MALKKKGKHTLLVTQYVALANVIIFFQVEPGIVLNQFFEENEQRVLIKLLLQKTVLSLLN